MNRYFLYGIGIIAVIGILACVIGYTLPAQTPTQKAALEAVTTTAEVTAKTTVTTRKKSSCGCCAERRARLEKLRQQAQARKQAREQAAKTAAR